MLCTPSTVYGFSRACNVLTQQSLLGINNKLEGVVCVVRCGEVWCDEEE